LSKEKKSVVGQNSLIIQDCFDILTPRESEIIYLTSLGFKSKKIASCLGLCANTIDDAIYKIKMKYYFSGNKKNLAEFLVNEKKLHHFLPISILMNAKNMSSLLSK
jgi:FixJ family two-component response regulator